jgi:hypothetical protein
MLAVVAVTSSLTLRSVDQWNLSGQCCAVQNRRSASCWVSEMNATVPYCSVSP